MNDVKSLLEDSEVENVKTVEHIAQDVSKFFKIEVEIDHSKAVFDVS